MARHFFWSVVAGALLAVLGALALPLPQHQRVRSQITVLNDGGRAEVFTIQWPRDRIELPASRDSRMVPAGPALELHAGNGQPVYVEAFRVRDAAGNVVGVASRTVSRAGSGAQSRQGSDWILLIPSRGALFMTEINAADIGPRASGGAGSPIASATDRASVWNGTHHLQVSAGPGADARGKVLRGTEEFAGLAGSFIETWDLDASPAASPFTGRITLATELRTVSE